MIIKVILYESIKGQTISKANYVFLNFPKTWTKLTIPSKEYAQESKFRPFCGRIEDTKNCFPDLLTFGIMHNMHMYDVGLQMSYDFKKIKLNEKNYTAGWYVWGAQKKVIFQNRQFSIFFVKIYWIGPWVSRIEWCEGHWFGSTYMAVRLSDISSKMA